MGKLLFLTLFIFSSISLHAYQKKIVLGSFSAEYRAQKMIKSLPKRTPTLYEMSQKYDFVFNVKEAGKYYILVAEVFDSPKVLLTVLKEARKRFPGAYPNESTMQTKTKVEPVVSKKAIEKTEPVIAQEKSVEDEQEVLEVKEVNTEIVDVEMQVIKKKEPLVLAIASKDIEKINEIVKTEENLTKVDIIVPNKQEIKTVQKIESASEPLAEPKEEVKEEVKKQVIKDTTESEESFFHWSYILILLLLGAGTHYFIKFKRIYDEY